VYFRFDLPNEIIPTHVDKFMSKLFNVVETFCSSFLLLLTKYYVLLLLVFRSFAIPVYGE